MKNKVLSIDQMKHLKELGMDTSDAKLCWVNSFNNPYELWFVSEFKDGKSPASDLIYDFVPTYTLDDILCKLPKIIEYNNDRGSIALLLGDINNLWICCYFNDEFIRIIDQIGDSRLEASYNMLCWCLENGYIKK